MILNRIAALEKDVYPGSSIAYDPDSKAFVFGGTVPGQLVFWHHQTDRCDFVSLDTGLIEHIAFSAAQPVFATAGQNGQIKLWESLSRKHIHTLETPGVFALVFCPHQPVLVSTALHERKTFLWDTDSGKLIETLEFGAVAFSPDGQHLVISGQHGIHIHEARTGRLTRQLTAQPEHFTGADYHSNGTTLAVINASEYIELWDLVTGQQIAALQGERIKEAGSVAFCPGTNILVSSYLDDTSITFWNIEQQKLIYELYPGFDRPQDIVFSSEGNRVAFGDIGEPGRGSGSKITIWQISDKSNQHIITEQNTPRP